MNKSSKMSMRKKYSNWIIKSSEEMLSKSDGKSLALKKRKAFSKRPLSLPLIDLLVHPGETYDISKEYEFQDQLGFGTYSQVKRALRIKDGATVAVKICSGTTGIELLKKERLLLQGLNCSLFPQIFDFKMDKIWNKAYLIMENIEGQTLSDYIRKFDKLPVETIEGFINQLSAIIKYLHMNQICHRDVKPENIIVTKDQTLRLLDFNISKRMKNLSEDTIKNEVFYTQISTPRYAAPEILSKSGYTSAIDIWGIGIIGYLLCGGSLTQKDINTSEEISQEKKYFKNYIASSETISEDLKIFLCSWLEEDPANRPSITDKFFNSDIISSILSTCSKFKWTPEEIKEE